MRRSVGMGIAKAFVALGILACATGQAIAATQQVRLDFTTNPGNGTTSHIYTASEQSDILTRMQQHYAAFDFSFSLTVPSGQFSTITFNAPGITGGLADTIDFRNLIKNDNARVNVNGLLGGGGQPAATSVNWVALSSLVGSHELGHLQGLRHGDAQGPIGSGVATNAIKTAMNPDYPGSVGATESGQHVMGSPASVGQTLFQAVGTTFFGEREDVKLSFNQTPNVVAESGVAHGTTGTAQAISLVSLAVPNTLGAGTQNFGKTFDVDAIALTGSIGASGQQDFYSFTADAGLLQVEVNAAILPSPRTSSLNPQITILDALGNAVAYYGGAGGAFNDAEFESNDATLIDVVLPTTGTYFAKVNGLTTSTGSYELFAYTFAVPEPAMAGMALISFSLLLSHRGRRGET